MNEKSERRFFFWRYSVQRSRKHQPVGESPRQGANRYEKVPEEHHVRFPFYVL